MHDSTTARRTHTFLLHLSSFKLVIVSLTIPQESHPSLSATYKKDIGLFTWVVEKASESYSHLQASKTGIRTLTFYFHHVVYDVQPR
jgi:hypothetical protein